MKDLLKQIALGKSKPCKEFNPDCAKCRLYILHGLMIWYTEAENDDV